MNRIACLTLLFMLPTMGVVAQSRNQPTSRPRAVEKPALFTELEYSLDDIAEGWRLAAKSSTGTTVYYDRARITRPSPDVFRLRVKYAEPGEQGNYMLNLEEHKCSDRTTRTLTSTRYKKDGSPLESVSITAPRWGFVIPDSIGETILEIVCQKRKDLRRLDMEAAARYYIYGLEDEASGDYAKALEWFEWALEIYPYNSKLKTARDRVKNRLSQAP